MTVLRELEREKRLILHHGQEVWDLLSKLRMKQSARKIQKIFRKKFSLQGKKAVCSKVSSHEANFNPDGLNTKSKLIIEICGNFTENEASVDEKFDDIFFQNEKLKQVLEEIPKEEIGACPKNVLKISEKEITRSSQSKLVHENVWECIKFFETTEEEKKIQEIKSTIKRQFTTTTKLVSSTEYFDWRKMYKEHVLNIEHEVKQILNKS
eukprot:snap_masked-scaffold_48-processed-gene-1.55-mRNA-1 protein AED:1.00 eAED:1.00 QI:0/-1/0/0/-1/1/1/0/208